MLDVKTTLNDAEERMQMAAMYLEDQLSHIRAGRANVAILDGIRVNSYGSMVPLNQVANVSAPDAPTIAIRPWDRKTIKVRFSRHAVPQTPRPFAMRIQATGP